MNQNHIRNFCIIAHIDHGKSTLADRFLECTGSVDTRHMRDQLLDTMEIERERGITIKLQPVRMNFSYNGFTYQLNLIDTPGHVDFSYEVSRSLAAVEGAILLVDASQGIEAQTLANLYQAMEHDLTIIPVVNKIDLPSAEPAKVAGELVRLLGVKKEDILFTSGKTGAGVNEVLAAVVERISCPKGELHAALKALVFDSRYDSYRGVIASVRVMEGQISARNRVKMMQAGVSTEALEVGHFVPDLHTDPGLEAGEIGYVVTGFKDVSQVRVGETITLELNSASSPLAGYREVKPVVYAGIFPVDANQFPVLREALGKLKLNDAALQYEPETSVALGFGFRGGFLGLLHLEIVRERLEREYHLDLIATTPSVSYKIILSSGDDLIIHSPADLPDPSSINEIVEPWVALEVVTPKIYTGAVMELSNSKRGIYQNMFHLDEERVILKYELPLSELIIDFYDRLKNVTSGYSSMNYELIDSRSADLVKLSILVAGDEIDSLSAIVHRSEAVARGREIIAKLKKLIPRQLFEVTLQAAIGGKIVAREDISAVGKNVTAKLYGGDVTRKRKLWEKQKQGKERLKRLGKVDIPADVFMDLLKS